MRHTCQGSCVGCKYLYQEGTGYSNYTWENDDVRCALDKNSNLPCERPEGWAHQTPEQDQWWATKNSRCESFVPGPYVALDVEGDDGPADHTADAAQIAIICEHSGRQPHSRGER